ncbi:MAG TPA: TonB-dependent receptor [Gemmatimonadales bacterium]|nr:TonB-dependent receptor [Gemmatimonadales bacterium]
MLETIVSAWLGASLAITPMPGGPADSTAAPGLTGRVTSTADSTPIVGARVTVVEAGRTVLTDPEGKYRITALPAGTYVVSVSMIGFAPQARRVQLGSDLRTLDFALVPSLVELPPIQVTSTPGATDPLSSPQPTAVLDGSTLATAQAPSLGETLNQVAGVHSLSTGAGIGKPVIRGLTSNRVLILDDGQRLETQQWGDEHGPNIETAMADRIEVIRGPASVLYGSDALGGVVNVIPKPLPTAEDGRSKVSGEATASYSTNNREPDGALLLEGASGALGFRATLSGRTSDNVRTPDYTLWNSGNRALGGSLAAGARGGWGSLTGTFSQRDEKIELTDEDPTATPFQRIATSRGRIDGMFPVGMSRLEVTAGFEQNRRREFEEAGSNDVALGLLSRNYTLDAHLHHAPLGQLSGVLGVSAGRLTFDKFGEETLIPNTDVNSLGLFGFEQLHAGRWDLSIGARYDYRHMDVSADNDLGVAAQTRSWNSVTGNLGVLYKVAEPVALVLNLGRGFRAPSSFDLFSNGVHEGTVAFERGNPDLHTEKSLNTDLTLRVQTGNAAAEIGGFVNWIQDYIYTVPTGTVDSASGFQIYDVTQGNARLAGFEFAGQYHPTAWLHLQGTADYVRGTNTSTSNALPAMPPFRATYTLRFEPGSGAFLRRPYLSVGGESNARQTRLDPAEAAFFADAFGGRGYRSAAYTIANAGAGFTLGGGPGSVQVDLMVRNLFDKAYADFLSRIKTNALDPGEGRTVVLKVGTTF